MPPTSSSKQSQTPQHSPSNGIQNNQAQQQAASLPPVLQLQQSIGNQAAQAVLQRQASNAGNPAPAQVTPLEQRRNDLNQARDIIAPSIAGHLFREAKVSTSNQALAFLNQDKQALALRSSLKKTATAAVEANIDKADGFNDQEKSDAKTYAGEHADKSGIVLKSLLTYVNREVTSDLPDAKKQSIEAKAKDGFNKVIPDPKTSLEKQKTAGEAQAFKYAKAETAQMSEQTFALMKKRMSEQIKRNSGFLDHEVTVEDSLGLEEVQKRKQLNLILVSDKDIDDLYTKNLYEPIKKAVLEKLGVGRGFFSRQSDEVKKFNETMKQAAVDQAHADIDTQITNHTLLTNKSALGKSYFGMIAKKKAHKEVDNSVTKSLGTDAGTIAATVLTAANAKQQMKAAAQSAAYGIARINSKESSKIREAATSSAAITAAKLLNTTKTAAVEEARKITKGDRNQPAQGPDQSKWTGLADGVKRQVTNDDVAGVAISASVSGDSINNALGKIGNIIDIAVPNAGDSGSFEFEIKIPVNPAVYVLIGFAGEAEREEKDLSVSSEITLGAGFQTFGLDANGRIGFYLESKSKNSNGVMNLLSYGMYREMQKISDSATLAIWSQGGKSGMTEIEEAELWASAIEEQDMSIEDAHVYIGLLARGQVEANAGVTELGASVGAKLLSRYDKDTLNLRSHNKFGSSTDLTKLKDKAEAISGSSRAGRLVLEGSANGSAPIGDSSVDLSLEAMFAIMDRSLREVSISVTGSIPFQYGEDAEAWAKHIVKLAAPIAGLGRNVARSIFNYVKQDKSSTFKAASAGADAGSDIMLIVPQFDKIGSQLASKLTGEETVNDTIKGWLTGDSSASPIEKAANKIALSSSLDLSLTFELKRDKDGKFQEWEISIEVGQTKSFEVDASFAKVALEKSKRLGKLAFGVGDNGFGVKGGAFGIEKTE